MKNQERGSHAPAALALYQGAKNKVIEKAAKRASRIDSRDLENNRRELQKYIFELQESFKRMNFFSNPLKDLPDADAMQLIEFHEKIFGCAPTGKGSDAIRAEIAAKSQAERERIATYFQFVATYLIAAGVVHLSDYLCVQFPKESTYKDEKSGEKKTRNETIRFTLGDIGSLLIDLTEGWSDPNPREAEPGIMGRIDQIHEMLNDLGNKFEAWTDENGIHDSYKYVEKTPSNKVQAETQEDDPEDPEGIEESKISDDELEAAKRGRIDALDTKKKEEM